jgi:hypothetical protein
MMGHRGVAPDGCVVDVVDVGVVVEVVASVTQVVVVGAIVVVDDGDASAAGPGATVDGDVVATVDGVVAALGRAAGVAALELALNSTAFGLRLGAATTRISTSATENATPR